MTDKKEQATELGEDALDLEPLVEARMQMFIEENAPFSMEHVITGDMFDCGTAACLAGQIMLTRMPFEDALVARYPFAEVWGILFPGNASDVKLTPVWVDLKRIFLGDWPHSFSLSDATAEEVAGYLDEWVAKHFPTRFDEYQRRIEERQDDRA